MPDEKTFEASPTAVDAILAILAGVIAHKSDRERATQLNNEAAEWNERLTARRRRGERLQAREGRKARSVFKRKDFKTTIRIVKRFVRQHVDNSLIKDDLLSAGDLTVVTRRRSPLPRRKSLRSKIWFAVCEAGVLSRAIGPKKTTFFKYHREITTLEKKLKQLAQKRGCGTASPTEIDEYFETLWKIDELKREHLIEKVEASDRLSHRDEGINEATQTTLSAVNDLIDMALCSDRRFVSHGFSDPHKLFVERDLINSCCKDQLDLDIVALRIQGLKDAEIATILSSSTSTISRRRGEIEKRFNAKVTSDNQARSQGRPATSTMATSRKAIEKSVQAKPSAEAATAYVESHLPKGKTRKPSQRNKRRIDSAVPDKQPIVLHIVQTARRGPLAESSLSLEACRF